MAYVYGRLLARRALFPVATLWRGSNVVKRSFHYKTWSYPTSKVANPIVRNVFAPRAFSKQVDNENARQSLVTPSTGGEIYRKDSNQASGTQGPEFKDAKEKEAEPLHEDEQDMTQHPLLSKKMDRLLNVVNYIIAAGKGRVLSSCWKYGLPLNLPVCCINHPRSFRPCRHDIGHFRF